MSKQRPYHRSKFRGVSGYPLCSQSGSTGGYYAIDVPKDDWNTLKPEQQCLKCLAIIKARKAAKAAKVA
jgi:hypothetical protein